MEVRDSAARVRQQLWLCHFWVTVYKGRCLKGAQTLAVCTAK